MTDIDTPILPHLRNYVNGAKLGYEMPFCLACNFVV